MDPYVTVLMPAYNAGKYIDEAIQSVLDQTYSDWELLIVNDGSTDDTVERVESFKDDRIRLLHNAQNMRLIKTLNRGLQEARGELIARLDSDDRSTPDRLELQVAALKEHPEWVMIGGKSNLIDATGKCVRNGQTLFVPTNSVAIRFASMFKNPFRHSAMTFRKKIVVELGGYSDSMQDVEDYALWSQLLEANDSANLANTVCDYREHGESIMATVTKDAVLNKQEPRRLAVQLIYERCAINNGVSETDAAVWGELWAIVRLPLPDEKCDVARTRKYLLKILKNRPNDQDAKSESATITTWAFFQLIRAARNQRSYVEMIRTLMSACWHQKTELINVILRRNSRKPETEAING